MGHDWPPITDIHCHLLPGIDDGAKCWDDALAMARQAVAEGITTSILTPHQLGNYTHTRGDTIRQLTVEFQRHLVAQQIPLRVLPGADVRIDGDMLTRLRSGDCLSLADTGKYVLLELPHELYMPLEPVLDALQRIGMVGILSHPERNEGLLRHPELMTGLVERGCLMQLTADSITGVFGEQPRAFSERMIRAGLIHFVASDAHSPRRRRPRMRAALETVAEWAGSEYAVAVGCTNPAAVAAGRPCPALPEPQSARAQGWFRKLFAGRAA